MNTALLTVKLLLEDDELDWAPEASDPDDSVKAANNIRPQVEIRSSTSPSDDFTAPLRVVLHGSLRQGEWVTHVENMQVGGYSTGCYFRDYEEAFQNYLDRCKKYRVNPNV
jgi:hypothetical protein